MLGTRRCASEGWGRLANVVLMGMGEPLANFGAVWPAVETMNRDLGLAARHLTISTVGVVPGIRKLATKPLQVNLAVSLHAANDALRDELVPLNRRYPIAMLMQACARVPGRDREEDLLRVGVHRRRQRPPFGRVRARRAGSAARGSRQPHPAQPDSRRSIAGPCRVASSPDPLAPGAAQRRRRQHHDPSEPGARHRRRVRPARCRRRARRAAHAPGRRAGGSLHHETELRRERLTNGNEPRAPTPVARERKRATRETEVVVVLELDGTGAVSRSHGLAVLRSHAGATRPPRRHGSGREGPG